MFYHKGEWVYLTHIQYNSKTCHERIQMVERVSHTITSSDKQKYYEMWSGNDIKPAKGSLHNISWKQL